jgi:hypothetical protein
MDWLRAALSRCAGLFGKRKLDADLEEELRAHIELAVEEHMRRGLSAADARVLALREFGGMTQTKEKYRVQRGLTVFETLLQDVRFACGSCGSRPGSR